MIVGVCCSVIYDVIDKIDDMLKQILSPTPDGEFAGSAIIKQVRRHVYMCGIEIDRQEGGRHVERARERSLAMLGGRRGA